MYCLNMFSSIVKLAFQTRGNDRCRLFTRPKRGSPTAQWKTCFAGVYKAGFPIMTLQSNAPLRSRAPHFFWIGSASSYHHTLYTKSDNSSRLHRYALQGPENPVVLFTELSCKVMCNSRSDMLSKWRFQASSPTYLIGNSKHWSDNFGNPPLALIRGYPQKTSKATTCLLNNYSIPVEKLHFVATPEGLLEADLRLARSES